jgi:hypothetical protein
MDEGKKKTVMIGIIVASLVVAGAVTIMSRSGDRGGIETIPEDATLWVTCRNDECSLNYEMQKREYYTQLDAAQKMNPDIVLVAPPLTCTKCSKPSLYLAYKCEKCGTVFEGNQFRGDFVDKCPGSGCGFSAIEQGRKDAAAAGGS